MKTTKVTPETYIRAESDRQFGVIAKMAGGVNRFYHFRRPTPLDKQNVVRMNRDTLYSMGIVDTSKGATITVRLGGPTGPVVGTSTVLAGAWAVRAVGSGIVPVAGDTITVQSSGGATVTGVPVVVRR